ncbi:LacI family transcriptional regulator [Kineococcus radiotolerans]|uniref:LacI family transcriptional regulator n=1 Tax=Kineococcus radiotolerans TaxID=131568 RepID=A0A7W4XY42_KINRA|nr:LacI family DNA-binding transcriptional regulator [Kineococcus radiotolerans]MBB2901909.1 LacI family transcriptional regulator [Kineococcus radiotolerans]
MAGARPPTMRDVAAHAGVSISTVSRVVNAERYVDPATREKVEASVAALGFLRNESARTLRPGQRTATLALVVEDLTNPFSAELAHGVELVAAAAGYVMLLLSTGRDAGGERDRVREREIVAELLSRRVDGVLVVPGADDAEGLYAALAARAPVVFVDRLPRGVRGDVVLLDNAGGGRRLTQWLLERGHRRIGYVGGDQRSGPGARRLSGFRAALRAAGVAEHPELLRFGRRSSDEARSAVEELLALAEPPTALFCDNNRMTVGALLAVHRARADVVLAGFDAVELAEVLVDRVALVTYDPADVGRRAAGLLTARLAGETSAPRRITVPVDLAEFGA